MDITTLGAPPPPEEASRNLEAPEVAPAMPPTGEPRRSGAMPLSERNPAAIQEEPSAQPPDAPYRVDGRSLRKTDRTVQFATRVSWEFDAKLRQIAQRDGLLLVEVLERALDAYEEARN